MAMLYAAFPSKHEAEKICCELLSMRLIACANMFPSSSIYLWKRRMVHHHEYIALMKTTKSNAAKAKKAILELHSYDVPGVMELPAKGNKEYEDWVKKACR